MPSKKVWCQTAKLSPVSAIVFHVQVNSYPWMAYITDQSGRRHRGCSASLVTAVLLIYLVLLLAVLQTGLTGLDRELKQHITSSSLHHPFTVTSIVCLYNNNNKRFIKALMETVQYEVTVR